MKQFTNCQLGLVVPCYNEEKRLDKTSFNIFLKENKKTAIVFVNDGSKDQTLKVLELFTKEFPEQTFILDRGFNLGKAESVREGVDFFVKNSKIQLIGYWDADLATPFSELNNFTNIFSNQTKHFVLGTRFKRLGADIHRKWYRHYIGRIFATLASIILKLPVYDTQCGAKIFTRFIAEACFSNKFMSKWLFDVELLFRVKNHLTSNKLLWKDSLYELPLNYWNDVDGSQLKLKDFLKAPFELLKIWLNYK